MSTSPTSTSPTVSIVIPTRNSAVTLRSCLESIQRQSYTAIEIVVVDNYSTDTTLEVARAMIPQVYTQGPERCVQRNVGAKVSNGSYLLFVDSDMILHPLVVEQCVQVASKNPVIKGVIIPEESVGEGFWAHCKALERSCYVGDDSIEAARFFDRMAFDAIGGYDEQLTAAEDWDLSQRIAGLGGLARVDVYITHLEGRLTLRKAMRSKYYYGKTLGLYIRKRPGTAARQLQFVRPAFIRHWRRLLIHPILTLGMVVMKGGEFAAGGAGLIVALRQQWMVR